jgi:hypothetical protein
VFPLHVIEFDALVRQVAVSMCRAKRGGGGVHLTAWRVPSLGPPVAPPPAWIRTPMIGRTIWFRVHAKKPRSLTNKAMAWPFDSAASATSRLATAGMPALGMRLARSSR